MDDVKRAHERGHDAPTGVRLESDRGPGVAWRGLARLVPCLLAAAVGASCSGAPTTETLRAPDGGVFHSSSNGPDAMAVACAPGEQIACVCPGGEPGAQVCSVTGDGYGACIGCGGGTISQSSETFPSISVTSIPSFSATQSVTINTTFTDTTNTTFTDTTNATFTNTSTLTNTFTNTFTNTTSTNTTSTTTTSTNTSSIPASSHSVSSTPTTSTPTCANPPATVPVGFVPPVGIIGSAGGCTVTDDGELAACFTAVTDAGSNACNGILTQGATADGGYGTCGNCVYGTFIEAGMNAPAEWGTNLSLLLEPDVGNVAGGYLVDAGPEIGVCVYAAGGAAAHQCGLDIMANDDCVYSSCIGLCPVAEPAPGSGFNPVQLDALQSCFSLVEAGACASYATKSQTDCAPFTNTDMTGIYDRCIQASEQASEEDSGVAPIPNAYEKLIQLSCTGGDAGAL